MNWAPTDGINSCERYYHVASVDQLDNMSDFITTVSCDLLVVSHFIMPHQSLISWQAILSCHIVQAQSITATFTIYLRWVNFYSSVRSTGNVKLSLEAKVDTGMSVFRRTSGFFLGSPRPILVFMPILWEYLEANGQLYRIKTRLLKRDSKLYWMNMETRNRLWANTAVDRHLVMSRIESCVV
jgi:hypothetical protein